MTHYAPMVAALITILLTTIFLLSKNGQFAPDVPNERSLHDTPTPRIGGIGLMAGVLVGWALAFKSLQWWIVLPVLMLFAVSLWDDFKGLPVKRRLLVHLLAAAVLVIGSQIIFQSVLLGCVVWLGVVWTTNLYNFMDGSDGLAGSMAFCGFTVYGAAALMHGNDTQAMLNFTIAAAALGFLYNNFPPAKVFMGDAGSISLGFLAAAMGIWGWQDGLWAMWFPVLVFSPFVVDASVTLFKRGLRREKVWQAHREHYYQRLVLLGWSHQRVLVAEGCLMAAVGASALYGLHQASVLPLLGGWCGVYAGLMLWVDRRWAKAQSAQ
jgi:UDP-GlcNAc:undecaprenyl-phosphate/decaprenyl-phosphate GlcNAc-1-phosphate transferase